MPERCKRKTLECHVSRILGLGFVKESTCLWHVVLSSEKNEGKENQRLKFCQKMQYLRKTRCNNGENMLKYIHYFGWIL